MAENWAPCRHCPHLPGDHEAIIVKPVCIDDPARVLFEGTLGACKMFACNCRLWERQPTPLQETPEQQKELLRAQRVVPEGCELVAAPDDRWRVAAGKLCARRLRGQRTCRRASVAEFNRGQYRFAATRRGSHRVDAWWPYCDPHMAEYGHWIEDGKVMHWVLREVKDNA